MPAQAQPIVIDDEEPPATRDEGLAAFLPPSDHEAWTKVKYLGQKADPYYGFKHSGVSGQVTCHQTKQDRGRAKRLAVAMCYQLIQGKTKKDILSFRAQFLTKWADKPPGMLKFPGTVHGAAPSMSLNISCNLNLKPQRDLKTVKPGKKGTWP